MAVRDTCDLCVQGHGICIKDNTLCQCFAGFAGPTCSDPVSINSTNNSNSSNVNIGAIIAGVLGGVLLTLTIGLVTFFLWRKRRDQRNKSLEVPVAPPKAEPVSTLYNFPLSQYDSSVSSASTMTYHLYEEIP
ncbi:unnamed protein product [Adineta ricciae]|uniref:receptor protein-tyrosine kinase n=1 Tax=Adineta ricciae TaxID=249248 RepID=A0A814XG80_ADIRI|nr:unnamed protein product [Adineta ricciae]CAF1213605.1 unnamed protein product [Adineta ricciae]